MNQVATSSSPATPPSQLVNQVILAMSSSAKDQLIFTLPLKCYKIFCDDMIVTYIFCFTQVNIPTVLPSPVPTPQQCLPVSKFVHCFYYVNWHLKLLLYGLRRSWPSHSSSCYSTLSLQTSNRFRRESASSGY